jgi:hypothetical protein
MAPYTDNVRPRFIKAAWFIIPPIVYLYQSIILQQAAKRLFLEPLNYRGQPSWPSRFGARNLRRRIESAMVAHWSAMLFGPIVDGLFWIILTASEGKRCVAHFKFHLLATLIMVVQWYVALGTKDPNVVIGRGTRRFYICIMVLCFAGVSYDWYTNGLTLDVFLRYLELLLQVGLARSIIPFIISITRLTIAEIRRQWEAEIRRWRAEIRRRWGAREISQERL